MAVTYGGTVCFPVLLRTKRGNDDRRADGEPAEIRTIRDANQIQENGHDARCIGYHHRTRRTNVLHGSEEREGATVGESKGVLYVVFPLWNPVSRGQVT